MRANGVREGTGQDDSDWLWDEQRTYQVSLTRRLLTSSRGPSPRSSYPPCTHHCPTHSAHTRKTLRPPWRARRHTFGGCGGVFVIERDLVTPAASPSRGYLPAQHAVSLRSPWAGASRFHNQKAHSTDVIILYTAYSLYPPQPLSFFAHRYCIVVTRWRREDTCSQVCGEAG
jgi:hypothetical protein